MDLVPYCDFWCKCWWDPYEQLPLGSITPEGWLREKLELQRDNISKNLDTIYPQVMGPRNGWLGGDGDH